MNSYRMPLGNKGYIYTTLLIVACSGFSTLITAVILNLVTLAIVGA